MAALYPKMKPMLQFTTLPPPVEEKRRRKRRPVKTPANPRVKAVHLQDEENENWPDGCLKWVSPQFRRTNYNSDSSSDEELSNSDEEDTVMPHPRVSRRNTKRFPLEMKELFPDKQRSRVGVKNGDRMRKKNAQIPARRVLKECTFNGNSRSNDHERESSTSVSQGSHRLVCSQNISLYPSTCKVRLNRERRARRNESIMDGGHQLEYTDSSKESCDNTPVGENPITFSQASNQIETEHVLESGSDLHLRLSCSTEHSSGHSTNVHGTATAQSTPEMNKMAQNEHSQGQTDSISNRIAHSEEVCHISESVLFATTDSTHPHTNGQEAAMSFKENGCSINKDPSVQETDSNSTQYNPVLKKEPSHISDTVPKQELTHTHISGTFTDTHNSNVIETSLVCDHESISRKFVNAATPKSAKNSHSFVDMKDLSAMVANMSLDYNNEYECDSKDVGDCAYQNEMLELNKVTKDIEDCGYQNGTIELNKVSKLDVCAEPSVREGLRTVSAPYCSNGCVIVPPQPPPPSSAVSVFEVTTFKPPCASTPFRFKPNTEHRPLTGPTHQDYDHTTVVCTPGIPKDSSASCRSFKQDVIMSVKDSPYANKPDASKSTKSEFNLPSVDDASVYSCLAYETPEHLWCSLNPRFNSKPELEIRSKPTIDESMAHSPPPSSHAMSLGGENERRTSNSQFCDDFEFDFDSDATRLSLDCESYAVHSYTTFNDQSESVLAKETPEQLWTASGTKAHNKCSAQTVSTGMLALDKDSTMSVDISRVEGTFPSETSQEENSFRRLAEMQKTFCQETKSKVLKCSKLEIFASETPEHLWSSQRVKPQMLSYNEADNTNAMLILDDISKVDPTCPSSLEPSSTSKKNSFIPLSTHYDQLQEDTDMCTWDSIPVDSKTKCRRTRFMSEACVSLNVEASVLAQETPEYMWLSPVVKVIGDSFA